VNIATELCASEDAVCSVPAGFALRPAGYILTLFPPAFRWAFAALLDEDAMRSLYIHKVGTQLPPRSGNGLSDGPGARRDEL